MLGTTIFCSIVLGWAQVADFDKLVSASAIQTRKVDGDGHFVYKGLDHTAGRGLAHETIAIKRYSETGVFQVFFCNVKLASLENLKVSRMSCPYVSTMS